MAKATMAMEDLQVLHNATRGHRWVTEDGVQGCKRAGEHWIVLLSLKAEGRKLAALEDAVRHNGG